MSPTLIFPLTIRVNAARKHFFFEGSTGGEDPPPEIIPLYLAHDGRIEKFYKCFVALHC